MTYLVDAYRTGNSIAVWLKTPEDKRITFPYKAAIYIEFCKEAEQYLLKHNIPYEVVWKLTYLRKWKRVYEVIIEDIGLFERFIYSFEKETKHRIPLFNADIKPEQQFLYSNNLIPCSDREGNPAVLTRMNLRTVVKNNIISRIVADKKEFSGDEFDILLRFTEYFRRQDPDVIIMEYAYANLPILDARIKSKGLYCAFHRWDAVPIKYKGGRAFYTYGNVNYRDYAIKLHGRFLVDTSATIGHECDVEALVELVQISGARFQDAASRSFGFVFQSKLMREMYREHFLVPYKEKPIDKPLSMHELLKSDRAGHTFDPLVGFHKNVVEIDFTSMFPWIMYNHNVSADMILTKRGPFSDVPGIPVRISHRYKGLIPRSIKPFIDRRMQYKANPSAVSKARAVGLKWVLVSSNGYLRFREFKLGLATSHMAVCAYAREILMGAAQLAEECGFTVVHGIVDSIFLTKKNMTPEEIDKYCEKLKQQSGIPVGYDGIFKWVCFLPSLLEEERPVPARYFGAYENNEVKARGIEVRQRNTPLVVKYFQQNILEDMAQRNTKSDILRAVPEYCRTLRHVLNQLPNLDPKWLLVNIKIAQESYKHNVPQKIITEKLKAEGIKVNPGQYISFIYSTKGPVLEQEYKNNPDTAEYRKKLVRALHMVLMSFDITKEYIEDRSRAERQSTLTEFAILKSPEIITPKHVRTIHNNSIR